MLIGKKVTIEKEGSDNETGEAGGTGGRDERQTPREGGTSEIGLETLVARAEQIRQLKDLLPNKYSQSERTVHSILGNT